MRIIAGRWRGRRLASVGRGQPSAHLRPTSDRVRESLFNLLANGPRGDAVAGARVLDLFAGTGALGLEALSRGAAHATFVDDGSAARALLRENIAICAAEAPGSNPRIRYADSLSTDWVPQDSKAGASAGSARNPPQEPAS